MDGSELILKLKKKRRIFFKVKLYSSNEATVRSSREHFRSNLQAPEIINFLFFFKFLILPNDFRNFQH